MSRRHGGRAHRSNGHAHGRPVVGPRPSPSAPHPPEPIAPDRPEHARPVAAVDGPPQAAPDALAGSTAPLDADPARTEAPFHSPSRIQAPERPRPQPAGASTTAAPARQPLDEPRPNGHAEPPRSPDRGPANGPHSVGSAGCTAPQLRRFIKSRPYVPMHELRRRFGINGAEDEVTPVQLADGQVWVGLPRREGDLLGELLRNGEIGYELSLDPRSPIVVGLYPMRPVPRA